MAGDRWLAVFICLMQVCSLAVGMKHIGCFADAGHRDLPVLASRHHVTVRRCFDLCAGRRFPYFGVQAGHECWCGLSFGRYGGRRQGDCSVKCRGDHNFRCGGGWRNDVYATGLSALQLPAARQHAPIRNSLIAKVKSLYKPIPSGSVCYNCIVRGFTSRSSHVTNKVFSVHSMDSVLAHMPAAVASRVKVLRFASRTIIDKHEIRISGNHVTRRTYLGIANKQHHQIHLSFLTAHVVGTLVHKYREYRYRKCWRSWWRRKCRWHSKHVRRGYHAREIHLIHGAMESETMRLFGEQLGHVTL